MLDFHVEIYYNLKIICAKLFGWDGDRLGKQIWMDIYICIYMCVYVYIYIYMIDIYINIERFPLSYVYRL